MVKNCDRGLGNAARGRRPRVAQDSLPCPLGKNKFIYVATVASRNRRQDGCGCLVQVGNLHRPVLLTLRIRFVWASVNNFARIESDCTLSDDFSSLVL